MPFCCFLEKKVWNEKDEETAKHWRTAIVDRFILFFILFFICEVFNCQLECLVVIRYNLVPLHL